MLGVRSEVVLENRGLGERSVIRPRFVFAPSAILRLLGKSLCARNHAEEQGLEHIRLKENEIIFNIHLLHVAFKFHSTELRPSETQVCYFYYESGRDGCSHMNMTHCFKYRGTLCECRDSLQPGGCVTHKHKAAVVNHETSDSKLIVFSGSN